MELEEILGVKGYRIGGKTGTSEDGVNTNKYVTSFIGVAPISAPSVTILITLYNPTGEGGHQGGGVAAPVGAKLFEEILPYLEVVKDGETAEQVEVDVPNVEGKTLKEAESILKESGLKLVINNVQDGIDKITAIIKEQTPKALVKTKQGTNVYVDL